MKKILIVLLFFVSYLNVYAVDNCTSGEMARLKELAKNVEFKYNYKFENINEEYHELWVQYNFEILNYSDDLKIYLNNKNNVVDINTFKDRYFLLGDKTTFYIYSYTNNSCTDELLRTVNINLPSYNEYYYFNKEKCSNYPDFEFCKEFMNVSNYSFAEIDEKFAEYIKDDKTPDLSQKSNYKLYIIIAGTLLVFIIVVFVLVIKKIKMKDEL